MQPDDTKQAREVEQLIDSGYRDYPIFSYPIDVAAYGLLAAYDSHILVQVMVNEASGGAPFTAGEIQFFKAFGEGFIWAMRWLLMSSPRVDPRPTSSEQLIADSNNLIVYGSNYSIVATMYSGMSQGYRIF
jgi:hypothetical protein